MANVNFYTSGMAFSQSRALINSGKEVAAKSDFFSMINAQYSDKMDKAIKKAKNHIPEQEKEKTDWEKREERHKEYMETVEKEAKKLWLQREIQNSRQMITGVDGEKELLLTGIPASVLLAGL